ncbi:MAG: chemotaxis protein CheW [Bdellovibrionales bacterium CG12_big_fil_rev_8_21_14_0_65_38_15]|nr:MAG: chemotaxis protein CheW [Bdellovibrionales bacterium CG22_combo_CG10-13_8_21_14_all_38_13]PIQ57415.1 MAG: chemotaxis protein CheW [Bdellovibrionales bacterium CG12_big_fil_rev_8_21_14_0_65_38_15]PIR31135.1 MAG: chemotaxis protein CheW [Bdellovibrionales bacterium CG11_big_fil_rev_8_21_14_0_20_38_13]
MKTSEQIKNASVEPRQFSTFVVDGQLYGIDVMKVQEVTKPLAMTKMKSAPAVVRGLINLRGQIATAIDLNELFEITSDKSDEQMTIVCKSEDILISLLVDTIGDVIEVENERFEKVPITIPTTISIFMKGVYKTENGILSILCLDTILNELERKCA